MPPAAMITTPVANTTVAKIESKQAFRLSCLAHQQLTIAPNITRTPHANGNQAYHSRDPYFPGICSSPLTKKEIDIAEMVKPAAKAKKPQRQRQYDRHIVKVRKINSRNIH
mmetsp:Transcript_3047/g.3627  ORF Transcript_3047/g.3627 Transcript_3047/m.3627 type:complete len:111 (-) Transcript_3047:67-399(-)